MGGGRIAARQTCKANFVRLNRLGVATRRGRAGGQFQDALEDLYGTTHVIIGGDEHSGFAVTDFGFCL
jgi:hypothetical protein